MTLEFYWENNRKGRKEKKKITAKTQGKRKNVKDAREKDYKIDMTAKDTKQMRVFVDIKISKHGETISLNKKRGYLFR